MGIPSKAGYKQFSIELKNTVIYICDFQGIQYIVVSTTIVLLIGKGEVCFHRWWSPSIIYFHSRAHSVARRNQCTLLICIERWEERGRRRGGVWSRSDLPSSQLTIRVLASSYCFLPSKSSIRFLIYFSSNLRDHSRATPFLIFLIFFFYYFTTVVLRLRRHPLERTRFNRIRWRRMRMVMRLITMILMIPTSESSYCCLDLHYVEIDDGLK